MFLLCQYLALPHQLLDPPASSVKYEDFEHLAAHFTDMSIILVYPKQAMRLLRDPVKGLFVPLIVLPLFLCEMPLMKFLGFVLRHYHHRNHQLRGANRTCSCRACIRSLLVCLLFRKSTKLTY